MRAVEAYMVSTLTLSKNMSMTRARPSPLLKHSPDFRMELNPIFLKHAYWQLFNSLLATEFHCAKIWGRASVLLASASGTPRQDAAGSLSTMEKNHLNRDLDQYSKVKGL